MNLNFSTRGFLKSLIMNPSSALKNSEWPIQYGERKCRKLLNWDDIMYLVVFRVANSESEFQIQEFKTADPIWRTAKQKFTWLGYLTLSSFWSRRFWIQAQNSKIQNDGSNMRTEKQKVSWLGWNLVLWRFGIVEYDASSKFRNSNWRIEYDRPKSYLITMKFDTQGLLRSMKTNPVWIFRYSKRQIQYGWLKCKKLRYWDEIWCSGVFGVADYKSVFSISNWTRAGLVLAREAVRAITTPQSTLRNHATLRF